tara:strand:+ start:8205 stop:8819 length:615 start_codon:yes stop_codon:yes gene_type:complete
MKDFDFDFLLNERYFILYLFLVFILYNLFRYKFGFNSFTNILFTIVIIIYIIYSHRDLFINRFYTNFLINDGEKFIRKIIGDNNINNDLTVLLYNARILYPFDRKNYIECLKHANNISQLKIRLNTCPQKKQIKINLKNECQNLVNTFSSINYSLHYSDKSHHGFLKELRIMMYNYCYTHHQLENVDSNHENKGVEKTFNYYLV